MTERRLVLSVEDNDANYALVQRVLETTGLWQIHRARDVGEAIDELRRTPFAVVLIDIDLPGASGLELARTIKESPQWRSTPVVIVTASVMNREQDQARSIGCEYFLAKPFDIARLRSLVAEAAEG